MRPPFAHYACLDEEFDFDAEADYELCQAIVAGRMGLHPDGWGNHDPLPLRYLLRRRRELESGEQPFEQEVDLAWEAKHRRRPVEEPLRERKKPRPQPAWKQSPIANWWIRNGTVGEVQLTCDDCGAKFRQTANYGAGRRDAAAAMLRQMGHSEGWTHIAGRDRCPKCSYIPAPEPVGNGASQHDRHE